MSNPNIPSKNDPSSQNPIPEAIAFIKPLEGAKTEILSEDAVQSWVEEKKATEVIPQSQVLDTPKRLKGAHVFCAGIDNEVNSSMRGFLQRMGVQTFVPSGKGFNRYSIIEQYNLHNDFNFAVVVLSADAFLMRKNQDLKDALEVTDQATVFELGFLIGKLGRPRVAVIYQANDRFKRPTEYFDVLYTEYDPSGQWQPKLLRQMQMCGFEIHDQTAAV